MQGNVHRVHPGFEFRGQLNTAVHLECCRCLRPFMHALAIPFELIYREQPSGEATPSSVRTPEPRADKEPGPAAEDPGFSSMSGARIHLGQLAEEQLTLALPLKPLCKPECRGLCPQCGADREQGDCGCRPPLDPRLDILRDLRRQLMESSSGDGPAATHSAGGPRVSRGEEEQ
jgi:DUF177 domain-containing protein